MLVKPFVRPIAAWLGSNLFASLVCFLLVNGLKHLPFRPTTDIIGYPLHANFNINLLFNKYYVFGYAFPALALLLFLYFNRSFSDGSLRAHASAKSRAPVKDISEPSHLGIWLRQIMRVFVVGFATGLLWVNQFDNLKGYTFFSFLIGNSAIFTTALCLIAWTLGQLPAVPWAIFRERTLQQRVSLLNLLVSPMPIFALCVFSMRTQAIEQGGNVIPLQWAPLWLGVLVVSAAYFLIFFALFRDKAKVATVARLEENCVLWIPFSILCYLFIAGVGGRTGGIDFFHEGENLAAALLTQKGLFPWRDLITIHGLLEDPLRSGLGHYLFGSHRWGANQGGLLILTPLYFVFSYLFYVRFLRPSRLLPFAIAFLLPPVWWVLFNQVHVRFILQPLVFLALLSLLEKRGAWQAFLFATILWFQFIITPESAYTVLACFGVLVATEAWGMTRATLPYSLKEIKSRFSVTLKVAGWSAVILGIWFSYLYSKDSLGPYFFYFRNFASGHTFAGGIPIQWVVNDPWFTFAVFTMPVLHLTCFWYLVWCWRTGRKLSPTEQAVSALYAFNVFYYIKFLGRADGHIYHSFVMTTPLFVYVAYRILSLLDRGLVGTRLGKAVAFHLTRSPFTAAALIAIGFGAIGPAQPFVNFVNQVNGIPGKFRVNVGERSPVDRIGYGELSPEDMVTASDIKLLISAIQTNDEPFFDFANEPALYYYFLDRIPPSRYYHITMVQHEDTQRSMIEEVERHHPKIVSYQSLRSALGSSWDAVPNAVRTRLVSRYILKNYVPLLQLGYRLFFIRKDLAAETPRLRKLPFKGQTGFDDLYFRSIPCDWGWSMHFFSIRNHPDLGNAPRQEVAFKELVPASGKRLLTLEITPQMRAENDYLEVEFEKASRGFFTLDDGDPHVDRSALTRQDGHPPIWYPPPNWREIQFYVSNQERADARPVYRIPVSSCAQWYGYTGHQLILRFEGDAKVSKVNLVKFDPMTSQNPKGAIRR